MVGDNEDTPMSDVICTSTDPESFKNESLAADLIRAINNVLNEKEVYMLCNLYGVGRPQKQRWEMAEELGMTTERVRQIEFYAINRLKNNPKAKSLLEKYLS
jgi:DNA-directed RNA polymerase sigma subunit (sigma70/sigma32)